MHQSYLADELVAAIGPSIYAVLGEIQADVVSHHPDRRAGRLDGRCDSQGSGARLSPAELRVVMGLRRAPRKPLW